MPSEERKAGAGEPEAGRPRRRSPLTKRFKRARRSLRNWLIGLLGPYLVRLWMGSIRRRWCGEGLISPDPRGRGNVIYVFWHQRMLAFAHTHRGRGVRVLISAHGDGEMIARVIDALGFRSVRGSSTRGWMQALRELLADLGSGYDYAFTPDGPRGPRHVFQPGAIYFASRSGLPILPAAVAYARSWTLPTWDGFIIPRPFTRAVITLGAPIAIPPDLEGPQLEDWRRRLEETLRALTARTDGRFDELFPGAIPTAALLSPAAAAGSGRPGSPPPPRGVDRSE